MNKERRTHLIEAEHKAIDALSRYKFMMFGYWAAIWVHYAKDIKPKPSHPFKDIVAKAKEIKGLDPRLRGNDRGESGNDKENASACARTLLGGTATARTEEGASGERQYGGGDE